jgi:thiosulfate dehydrogenase [quinone] large subunit
MTHTPVHPPRCTTAQLSALVILRVLIGWHFLYEGIAKILNPNWTSASFLLESKWIFAGVFHAMALNPFVLKAVDLMNMWGLTAIGLGLIAGCFTRAATVVGMLLLLLYYVCNPPLIGLTYSIPAEGSYLIVNKNLIELCALMVLFLFPTGSIGLDRFCSFIKKPAGKSAQLEVSHEERTERKAEHPRR